MQYIVPGHFVVNEYLLRDRRIQNLIENLGRTALEKWL